jgi:hypothetical protein
MLSCFRRVVDRRGGAAQRQEEADGSGSVLNGWSSIAAFALAATNTPASPPIRQQAETKPSPELLKATLCYSAVMAETTRIALFSQPIGSVKDEAVLESAKQAWWLRAKPLVPSGTAGDSWQAFYNRHYNRFLADEAAGDAKLIAVINGCVQNAPKA